jgi:ubiquinone/menaquinone biosynthesis C-methylase UbiE
MSETTPDPWQWVQPLDVARLGSQILDRAEQERYCKAVFFAGSLPYMWKHIARVVRELVYEKMRLKRGHRVLVIGELVEGCGFGPDLGAIVGPEGDVVAIDITDEARSAYFAGTRGRGGQIATWQWTYTKDMPANSFDAVSILQAVQHTDDWRETGAEMARILKPGGTLMLAEITFSPRLKMLAEQDIHLQYWVEKIASRLGLDPYNAPYYSVQELRDALSGSVSDIESLVWKGIEIVWGQKGLD